MNIEKLEVRAPHSESMRIQCSVTDHLVSNIPVTVGFFYSCQIAKETLLQGLRQVLSDYPLFAGRLCKTEAGLTIVCNNQGLEFSVEQEGCNIETALYTLLDDIPEIEVFDIIDTSKVIEEQSALSTCKVIYYGDGAMSLGFCWHHVLGDMHSFMHFMKAFSNAVAGKNSVKPIIVSDRPAYLNQHIDDTTGGNASIRCINEEERAELMQYMLSQAPNKKRIQFYFTDNELKALKRIYNERSELPLSTNDALCAHMFSIMTECADDNKSRCLSIAINFRPRIPLPEDLLGNLISSINIDTTPDEQQQSTFIAKKIRNSINRYKEHIDYHANNRVIEEQGGMTSISQFIPKALDPIQGMFLVTNWSKFGVYDIDFGKQAPFYFTQRSSAPFPWMSSIVDGFGNSGLLFNSNLPTEVTNKLVEPKVLQKIHQYREPDEEIPNILQRLSWIN